MGSRAREGHLLAVGVLVQRPDEAVIAWCRQGEVSTPVAGVAVQDDVMLGHHVEGAGQVAYDRADAGPEVSSRVHLHQLRAMAERAAKGAPKPR